MEVFITIVLYIGIAITVSQFAWYAICSKYSFNEKVGWIYITIIPALVAAFRYKTGTDSNMYMNSYLDIGSIMRYQDFEKGYLWLVEVLNNCGFSYQMMFFLMNFMTLVFLFLLFKREKDIIDIKIATFIFILDLYLNSFNMMRQALAITMVMYAFSLFTDRKYIYSCFVIGAAMLFHGSALLGMAIVLGKIVFDNRYSKVMYVAVIYIVLYLINNRDLFGSIVYYISGSGYYASYITRDAESDGSLLGYFIKILPILLICLICLEKISKNKKMKVYFGMMFGGYILSALGVITATQVQRVGYYFSYLSIVVLAFCCKTDLVVGRIKIGKNVVKTLIILYYIVMFFYKFVYKGFCDLIPYQGFFY